MKAHYSSKIGWLELSATQKSLRSVRFLPEKPKNCASTPNAVIERVIQQLEEYFNGERTDFSIPLEPEGSEFQKSVWKHLQKISFGQTVTYGELAQKMGDPGKVRAVGNANGKNPIPIIIPCHRVIGANNNLVGYAGGITRKKYLLKHEGVLLI